MVAVLNSESIIRSFPIAISVAVLTAAWTARRMKFMGYMSKHGEGVGLTLPRARLNLCSCNNGSYVAFRFERERTDIYGTDIPCIV